MVKYIRTIILFCDESFLWFHELHRNHTFIHTAAYSRGPDTSKNIMAIDHKRFKATEI